MLDKDLGLLASYGVLKKMKDMQYVSSVTRIDNTIVVVNKDGAEATFDMIKGEQGERGTDYDIEVARESMSALIEEYKHEEMEEVIAILKGNDGS